MTVHVFAGCLCAVLSISYHIYESFPRNLHDRMLSADQVRSSQKKKSSVGSPRRSLFWTILSKSACRASLSPSQPFSAARLSLYPACLRVYLGRIGGRLSRLCLAWDAHHRL